MMSCKNFSTEDFVQDAYFRQWVLQPDPSSETFWHELLLKNPHQVDAIRQARVVVLNIQFQEANLSEAEIARIWEKIKQMNLMHEQADRNKRELLPRHTAVFTENRRRVQTRWYGRSMLKIAASFIGLLLVFYASYFIWSGFRYETYQTAYGETRTIILPDSSVVTLNANTLLKVPVQWSEQQEREVWLEGEAYFEVQKLMMSEKADDTFQKNAPVPAKFIVHTDNLQVEVLGTKFNVNTRRHKTQVVLNSGKVKLKSRKHEIRLEPGELAELSEALPVFTKRTVDTEPYSLWKENKLVCDGTTLGEIAKDMQDRFGVEVVLIGDRLAGIEASGTIPMDDINIFITVLKKSIGLDITKEGNRVLIREK